MTDLISHTKDNFAVYTTYFALQEKPFWFVRASLFKAQCLDYGILQRISNQPQHASTNKKAPARTTFPTEHSGVSLYAGLSSFTAAASGQ